MSSYHCCSCLLRHNAKLLDGIKCTLACHCYTPSLCRAVTVLGRIGLVLNYTVGYMVHVSPAGSSLVMCLLVHPLSKNILYSLYARKQLGHVGKAGYTAET